MNDGDVLPELNKIRDFHTKGIYGDRRVDDVLTKNGRSPSV